jgi:hypothetical protein
VHVKYSSDQSVHIQYSSDQSVHIQYNSDQSVYLQREEEGEEHSVQCAVYGVYTVPAA